MTKLVKHGANKVMWAYIYKGETWHQGLHFSDDLRLRTGIKRLQHDVEYGFFFRFLLYILFHDILMTTVEVQQPTSMGSSAEVASATAAGAAAGIAISWIFNRD